MQSSFTIVKFLLLFASIFFILLIVWHFFLSIYEVKIISEFNPEELKLKKKYTVKCVGLNAQGNELSFRNLECKFEIIEGKENIKILDEKENNSLLFSTIKAGSLVIEIESKYSLRPAQLFCSIKKDSI
ncbi:MAG: hypothetical protein CR986_05600 [Ignavibacteriae bacterium]|nr:MAG: hypothetical protein CR986_05600 [Ignavibacteriota bacterium]